MILRLLPACFALEKKEDLDKESRRWAGTTVNGVCRCQGFFVSTRC